MKTLSLLLAVAAISSSPLLRAEDKPAAAPATATKIKLDDLLPDPTVAKGKGFEIKRSELDEVVNGVKATILASGQQIPSAQLPLIEKELLDGMIQMRILNDLATAEQKAKGKEDAEKRISELKKQAPSVEAFNTKLKAMSLTPEKLLTRLSEESVAQGVMRAKVTVSDADAKKFYDDHPADFEQPEMVRASHILLSTKDAAGTDLTDTQKKAKRKQIEDILKRAREGEDFAKLAKEFSEDPGSKDKGGEYTFRRGQMVPEFEAAAFGLKATNDISDVVTTAYGYHIIKLLEKIPAQKVELAKASADIKTYLEKREIEKILPQYYVQLKKDYNVEILDEKLKALDDSKAGDAAAPAKTGVAN